MKSYTWYWRVGKISIFTFKLLVCHWLDISERNVTKCFVKIKFWWTLAVKLAILDSTKFNSLPTNNVDNYVGYTDLREGNHLKAFTWSCIQYLIGHLFTLSSIQLPFQFRVNIYILENKGVFSFFNRIYSSSFLSL